MRLLRSAVTLLALCLMFLAPGRAQAQGTAFTYQGKLENAGAPASGIYDFRFRLYTTETGSSGAGPVNCFDDQVVQGGTFSVTLDFGPIPYLTPYFLEISVRADGARSGCHDLLGFVTLPQRQKIFPAPLAQWSQNTRGITVDSAGNVTLGAGAQPVTLATNGTIAPTLGVRFPDGSVQTTAYSGPVQTRVAMNGNSLIVRVDNDICNLASPLSMGVEVITFVVVDGHGEASERATPGRILAGPFDLSRPRFAASTWPGWWNEQAALPRTFRITCLNGSNGVELTVPVILQDYRTEMSADGATLLERITVVPQYVAISTPALINAPPSTSLPAMAGMQLSLGGMPSINGVVTSLTRSRAISTVTISGQPSRNAGGRKHPVLFTLRGPLGGNPVLYPMVAANATGNPDRQVGTLTADGAATPVGICWPAMLRLAPDGAGGIYEEFDFVGDP